MNKSIAYLPGKENPLWKQFSQKVLKIAEAFGISSRDLAKELGLSYAMVTMLLWGGLMPSPEVASRIKRWAWDHMTFERSPRKATARTTAARAKWPRFSLPLPERLMKRVTARAASLGVSPAAFAHTAIVRLLERDSTLTTIRLAAEQIESARRMQILAENPDIELILDGEVALAVEIRNETDQTHATDVKEAFDVETIAKTTVVDGPASRVYDEGLEPV